MAFYDLTKDKRAEFSKKLSHEIRKDLEKNISGCIKKYFSDSDTYIRKAAYLAVGKIYFQNKGLQSQISEVLNRLFRDENERVRQTVVNAFGEIGKYQADGALVLFEKALRDGHHSVRNAVIGSLKKMGEKNPLPVLNFSKKFLHDPEPEVRRQAVHGVELRGRTHPEEVLPILEQLQDEPKRRVRNMVVHVLGQISYKNGCLEKVVKALKNWKNREIVESAVKEIIDTHKSYEKFSAKSCREAKEYLEKHLKI